MVTEALVAPLYAPLADRLGRRPVVLVLTMFWGIFAVGFGLVQTVWGAIIMRGCRECLTTDLVFLAGFLLSEADGGTQAWKLIY